MTRLFPFPSLPLHPIFFLALPSASIPSPFPFSSAVNYVAVTDALAASPSVVTAALAADNLLCAVYFTSLFALAANIGPEGREGETLGGGEEVSGGESG